MNAAPAIVARDGGCTGPGRGSDLPSAVDTSTLAAGNGTAGCTLLLESFSSHWFTEMTQQPASPTPPASADDLLQRVIDAARVDQRITGLLDYGSRSEGRADEWSDVDLEVFIRDEDYDAFDQEWEGWAAQFGPLLLAFVGDIDNHWVAYEHHPAPLRADFSLHRASVAATDTLSTWPNAPLSVDHMLFIDKAGTLRPHVEAMIGRDLGPPDVPHRFSLVVAGFWYYAIRTWNKLQRGPTWGVRFDIDFIMHGNLMALLRLEAGKVDRWTASDAAAGIEHDISLERLAALNSCIPAPDPESLAPSLARIIRLGALASSSGADRYNRPWPAALAARMVALTERDLANGDRFDAT